MNRDAGARLHMHGARRTGYAAALAAMLIASCSSIPSPSGIASSPGFPSPTPARQTERAASPVPSQSSAPVSMAAAWPGVRVLELREAIGTDRTFDLVRAATPDGTWLIGQDRPRDFMNSSAPTYLALANPKTGEIDRIHELPARKSQVMWASADADWIVWAEGGDTNTFYMWRIYAYDRHTHTTQLVARSAVIDGRPIPAPEPCPSVSHGVVVWVQADGPLEGDGGSSANLEVKALDLATGASSTVATAADFPTVSWPWAIYQRMSDAVLEAKNLETGQVVDIHAATLEYGVSGMSIAYNDPGSSSLSLRDDVASASSSVIPLVSTDAANGDHVEWPSLNARIVGWVRQNAPAEAFDRKQGRFVLVPAGNQWAGTTVVGPYLVWQDPDPMTASASPPTFQTQTLRMIDARELP